jgi:hypothetical protein
MAVRSVLEKTVNGNVVRVFGDKAKFEALVGGFTDAVAAAPTVISYSRSGGSYRQYPGDTSPISRGGASVDALKLPPEYKRVLPGRPFWLETSTGTGAQKVTTVRQFTFTGTFLDLRAAISAGATGNLVLRSPGGRGIDIADATP